jgi:hypothetical protein
MGPCGSKRRRVLQPIGNPKVAAAHEPCRPRRNDKSTGSGQRRVGATQPDSSARTSTRSGESAAASVAPRPGVHRQEPIRKMHVATPRRIERPLKDPRPRRGSPGVSPLSPSEARYFRLCQMPNRKRPFGSLSSSRTSASIFSP